MRSNKEYRNLALNCLRGNWAPAVVATIIYMVIAMVIMYGDNMESVSKYIPWLSFFNGASSGFKFAIGGGCWLLIFLLVGPLAVGLQNAMRVWYENGDREATSNMFGFGFHNYTHVVVTYLLMVVKIALWSLLLIIPGVIKGLAYAMTPYIIVEHPEYSASEAIAKSEELMRGHKMDYFLLELSFIGWYILSIFTLGIGFFWLEPYVMCASAAFYNDLKGGNGNPVILQD